MVLFRVSSSFQGKYNLVKETNENKKNCAPKRRNNVVWSLLLPRTEPPARGLSMLSPLRQWSLAPAIHPASSGSQRWCQVLGHCGHSSFLSPVVAQYRIRNTSTRVCSKGGGGGGRSCPELLSLMLMLMVLVLLIVIKNVR